MEETPSLIDSLKLKAQHIDQIFCSCDSVKAAYNLSTRRPRHLPPERSMTHFLTSAIPIPLQTQMPDPRWQDVALAAVPGVAGERAHRTQFVSRRVAALIQRSITFVALLRSTFIAQRQWWKRYRYTIVQICVQTLTQSRLWWHLVDMDSHVHP